MGVTRNKLVESFSSLVFGGNAFDDPHHHHHGRHHLGDHNQGTEAKKRPNQQAAVVGIHGTAKAGVTAAIVAAAAEAMVLSVVFMAYSSSLVIFFSSVL